MKLITPSFEIWEQVYKPGSLISNMWSHIARCVRVCYQSESKKNPSESDEAFVKRVIFRHKPDNNEANHLSVLEHGTVYLKFDLTTNDSEVYGDAHFATSLPFSRYHLVSNVYYLTTNFRVLVENKATDLLKYVCHPIKHHDKRVTVSFITNIGVTREFNRHRVNSISEESTRYCNYSLDRFDNSITCCSPVWIPSYSKELSSKYSQERLDTFIKEYGTENEHAWSDLDYYLFSLEVSNYCYNNLIIKGWSPQQAREVLPLATKTQLVHTAYVSDWIHFFKLRAIGISGKPHPNAQLLAKPLMDAFIEQGIIKESDVK